MTIYEKNKIFGFLRSSPMTSPRIVEPEGIQAERVFLNTFVTLQTDQRPP